MCHDLCYHQNLTLQKCLNYRDGKYVLLMKHGTKEVILKSQNIKNNPLDKLRATVVGGMHGRQFYPSFHNFIQMVNSHLVNRFKGLVQFTDKSVDWLFPPDFKKYFESDHTFLKEAAMETLWYLIQQEEYLYIKYFHESHTPWIPDFLGTCGYFYAVEKLDVYPTKIRFLDTVFNHRKNDWEVSVKLAFSFFDLVNTANSDFPEPIHLCDIKADNFGIARNGVIKLLDIDMVHFQRELGQILQDGSLQHPCTEHEHCDFFHCKGWCIKSSGKCSPQRKNNNLQVNKLLSHFLL